ncbi:potassium channel family protein, partial [Pseudomonas amygdali]
MKSIDASQQFNITISEPHDKGVLTTRIGRKIESVSFEDLLAVAFLALTISTEFFYIFTPLGYGLNTNQPWSISLALNSLYFSLVTFTTLGYGDISPVGVGRVVAVILVMCGLIIMTLTIGKVASERQQSLLLLLHTSDCQRRITGFIDDLVYRLKINFSHACVV